MSAVIRLSFPPRVDKAVEEKKQAHYIADALRTMNAKAFLSNEEKARYSSLRDALEIILSTHGSEFSHDIRAEYDLFLL